MKTLDPWDIIRVSKSASKQDLKKVYKKLAKRYHPDKPEGNKKKFMVLNWAYREIKAFIESREASFDTMKENSQKSDLPFNPNISNFANKEFDINKFNQLYDKFHVPQIKAKKIKPPPDKVDFPKVINGDINSAYDNFVDEKAAPITNNAIELLPSASMERTNLDSKTLGITEIDDCTNYSNPSMLMTDYEKAYQLRRQSTITERSTDLNEAKSIRMKPLNLSKEEQNIIEQRNQNIINKKQERQQVQAELDIQAVERFNQMTLLLNSHK